MGRHLRTISMPYTGENMKNNVFLKKLVNRETVSYLICGVLTTAVNYVVDLVADSLLSSAGVAYSATIANLIAWIVSVAFAFVVNKIFVFQSKGWKGKAFLKELSAFALARVASLGFESLFIFVTVDWLELLPNWIAKILSNVFVVIMNYFASKFFIFKKREDDNV